MEVDTFYQKYKNYKDIETTMNKLNQISDEH